MFQRIAELVVRVADLVEAEGRSLLSAARLESAKLHTAAANFAMGLALLLIAVPLVSGGICLLAYGALLALKEPLGLPAAAAIIGGAVAASGFLCVVLFKRMVRP